jgi:hypothetical protein
MLGLGSRTSSSCSNKWRSSSISNSRTLGLRRTASSSRSDEPDDERWLCGDELRVRGDVMDDELRMDEGDAERSELRVGLKAVLRRRREPEVLRRGVKDWKRLVRLGEEGMVAVCYRLEGRVVCCCCFFRTDKWTVFAAYA